MSEAKRILILTLLWLSVALLVGGLVVAAIPSPGHPHEQAVADAWMGVSVGAGTIVGLIAALLGYKADKS